MSKTASMPDVEEAFVSKRDNAEHRRLHTDDDCSHLKSDARPVDPAAYPAADWCQICTGEISESVPTNGGRGPHELLADEDVTSLDDLREAVGGDET